MHSFGQCVSPLILQHRYCLGTRLKAGERKMSVITLTLLCMRLKHEVQIVDKESNPTLNWYVVGTTPETAFLPGVYQAFCKTWTVFTGRDYLRFVSQDGSQRKTLSRSLERFQQHILPYWLEVDRLCQLPPAWSASGTGKAHPLVNFGA